MAVTAFATGFGGVFFTIAFGTGFFGAGFLATGFFAAGLALGFGGFALDFCAAGFFFAGFLVAMLFLSSALFRRWGNAVYNGFCVCVKDFCQFRQLLKHSQSEFKEARAESNKISWNRCKYGDWRRIGPVSSLILAHRAL